MIIFQWRHGVEQCLFVCLFVCCCCLPFLCFKPFWNLAVLLMYGSVHLRSPMGGGGGRRSRALPPKIKKKSLTNFITLFCLELGRLWTIHKDILLKRKSEVTCQFRQLLPFCSRKRGSLQSLRIKCSETWGLVCEQYFRLFLHFAFWLTRWDLRIKLPFS